MIHPGNSERNLLIKNGPSIRGGLNNQSKKKKTIRAGADESETGLNKLARSLEAASEKL